MLWITGSPAASRMANGGEGGLGPTGHVSDSRIACASLAYPDVHRFVSDRGCYKTPAPLPVACRAISRYRRR